MRIAAIADLHCRTTSDGIIRQTLGGVEDEADVLVLAGDLTDTGLPEEMEVLIPQLKRMQIPVIAVLGNHDHESGYHEVLTQMLKDCEVHVLEASVVEIDSVGFIGTKGFCGGFGPRLVQPFGEKALKDFINTSLDETLLLENALARVECEHKVAVLHYSPIVETLFGEPKEIYAFLGTSRLEAALDLYGVDVIFHGHAHHGSPEGRTAGGRPVHNVSRFVQEKFYKRPYCLYEIEGG